MSFRAFLLTMAVRRLIIDHSFLFCYTLEDEVENKELMGETYMKFNFIKEKIHARSIKLVIPLCLLLCACQNMAAVADGQGEVVTEDVEEVGSTTEENGSALGSEESGNGKEAGTPAQDAGDAELAGILDEIMAGGQLYPLKAEDSQKGFTIFAETKKGNVMVCKVTIDGQSALRIGNTYYPYDERLERFATEDDFTDDVINRLLSQSVQCDEPVEDMDYVNLAEKLVFSWLDTLKTEEGRYALESYTPNYTTLEAKGYVGNGTEFCASVHFETDIEDSTSAFYSEDGYDKFYHYYYGPMVYVRCHYENGRCEVVDYDDAFQADLTRDLNGTSAGTGPYPTFWEFYDDTENMEKLMAEAYNSHAAGATAASPIMLSDGQIGYVFIYPRNGATWEAEGKTYGVFDNYFSTSQGATYSSPIDYKDNSGACTEQYGKSFDLIWDDYNGDGNPEYAIKQDAEDEDENGARYEVRCMSNDMTPRSSRFDFYMAGRHEECIHLEMTERGVVLWSLVDGVMTPNQNVDDFRMYSRRYYLPGNMRGYTDEQEIQCFFWNNTDKEVSTGSTYYVEYLDGNEWVKVTGEKKIKSVKCPAYRDVTLSFDISGFQHVIGEYRIVLGDEKVCGGFYIRGDRVSARIQQDETSVTIFNDGTASLRIYDLCWVKDGEVAGKIEKDGGRDFGVVAAGSQKRIETHPLSTFDGAYSVRVDVGMILESEPVEYSYVRYFGDGMVSQRDGKLVLTVDVNQDVTGDAGVEWFAENDWKRTQYAKVGLELKAGKQEIVFEDRSGLDPLSAEYEDFYRSIMEELSKAQKDGRLDELSEEEQEEYNRVAKMSKEEFYYYVTGAVPMEALLAAPLRFKIANEYVYVNVHGTDSK